MLSEAFHMLPRIVQPAVRNMYYQYRDYRFYKIEKDCNGMLRGEIYSKLYSYAFDINAGNIIEVGSAHGAGTVSLALGVKESGGSATVVGVEKGEGGSRSRYGSKEDNISTLASNVEKYDVEDYVDLVDRRLNVEDGLPADITERVPFSLVVLDADGRLNRDFKLLYEHILPGSVIVIDDYAPMREYREPTERRPAGGGKHYRTLTYANHLLDEGYLNKYATFDGTLIATKPPESPDISDLNGLRTIREYLKADRERHA